MPLRDHFHPPVSKQASWEGFHGMWPASMVLQLVSLAAGRIHRRAAGASRQLLRD